MDDVQSIALPHARLTQAQLYALVNAIRLKESTYKSAGSVHACALFHGEQMQVFVEDVGRHNAIDTIAGWMWMRGVDTTVATPEVPYVFYTTGRLTSEMIIKSAQMGVPFAISRSGITQMGHQVAQQVGLCAIGRATAQRFLCFSQPQRLRMD
jgi:FdhD protein